MLTDERIDELAYGTRDFDFNRFARAIEAEVMAEVCSAQNSEYAPQDCLSLTDATQVRMEAQEPVASANAAAKMRFFRDMTSTERRKVFEAFGIESAVLNEVRSLSDETRLFKHLFTTPQPPAPCQKCAKQPPCTNEHVAEGCEQFPETDEQETHRTIAGLYAKNAIFLLRNADLRASIDQFDRAITRIGNHVGAVCAGVDTEDEHGPGGHTAVAIIEKFDALQAKVSDLTREVAQWKNNHATVVRQARVLKERTDMPLERVKAYEHYGEMIERVAELEKEVEVAKSAARYHATQTNEVNVVVAEQSAEIERLTAEAEVHSYWRLFETSQATIAQQAERIAELEKECGSNLRMFQAAILDLASISEALDCDPDDGGAAPIIEAIDELKARIATQAALIEKCEEALRDYSDQERRDQWCGPATELLAFIAAQKGGVE